MQGRPIKIGSLFAATLAKACNAGRAPVQRRRQVRLGEQARQHAHHREVARGKQQGRRHELSRDLPHGKPRLRSHHHPLRHAGVDGRPRPGAILPGLQEAPRRRPEDLLVRPAGLRHPAIPGAQHPLSRRILRQRPWTSSKCSTPTGRRCSAPSMQSCCN